MPILAGFSIVLLLILGGCKSTGPVQGGTSSVQSASSNGAAKKIPTEQLMTILF